MFFFYKEELEVDPVSKPRFRLQIPKLTDFLLWEVEQDIFIDNFLLEETQIPDSRGFLFYDSTNLPQTFELYKVGIVANQCFKSSTKVLWPFFDIEDFNVISLQMIAVQGRKGKRWKQHFGCFHNFFHHMFNKVAITHFISFNLVGVGYFCEFVNTNCIKIIVSNTNDLLFFTPPGVYAGCRTVLNGDPTSFFFYSGNRDLLFNYVKTVRNSVQFNIYEYQGLLYSCEKKIRKITKRKQK